MCPVLSRNEGKKINKLIQSMSEVNVWEKHQYGDLTRMHHYTAAVWEFLWGATSSDFSPRLIHITNHHRRRPISQDPRSRHTTSGWICDFLALGWMCSFMRGRASFPSPGGWWRGISRAPASQSRSPRRRRPQAGPTNPGTRGRVTTRRKLRWWRPSLTKTHTTAR